MCVLRCPLCNFVAFGYTALKRHIRKEHPLEETCPVCGKRCRNVVEHLHHEAEKGCEKHAVLYALYRKGNGRRTNSVFKRSRDLVFEKLSVTKKD